jgi:hypothetical protein
MYNMPACCRYILTIMTLLHTVTQEGNCCPLSPIEDPWYRAEATSHDSPAPGDPQACRRQSADKPQALPSQKSIILHYNQDAKLTLDLIVRNNSKL